jgi:hypothetical protein
LEAAQTKLNAEAKEAEKQRREAKERFEKEEPLRKMRPATREAEQSR